MGNLQDISEYILEDINASDSEGEEVGDNQITLAQKYLGKNNNTYQQRAIKLIEIGPRIEMKLIKIEKDLCGGEVVYHSYLKKTPEEIKIMNEERARKQKEKEARRRQQEINVERKKKEKEEHRRITSGKPADSEDDADGDDEFDETVSKSNKTDEVDDDVEYYRQELGEEPDEGCSFSLSFSFSFFFFFFFFTKF